MKELSRRAVMSSAAAFGAAALAGIQFAPAAKAAAPLFGTNASGFYRRKVGDIDVTWILDEVIVRDVGPGIARNAELAEIQKTVSEVWADGKVRQPFVPMVVNNGSKLILLDTGTGNRSGNGQYMQNFAAAGYDPKAVDIIVISHFHGDHIGGIRLKDESLAFPNAEIMVPAPEWAFWMNDENMNKAPEAARAGFMNVRRIFKDLGERVKQYEPGKEVVTNVTTLSTPGHTAGHTSFVIASGNQTMMTVVDAATLEIFVRNTNLIPNGDANPELALATRRRLLDMVVTDKLLTTGYHWPFPGASYVFKEGNGYRLVSAT
jgi:glyoxylase-like metal-dependent hydrolase (beta-lactamase superfamily II)